MAISKLDEHIEVRIKRPPRNSLRTYFEEYVDPITAEDTASNVCESYIVTEGQEQPFLIEIILKPGFKPYGADSVRVVIRLDNFRSETWFFLLPRDAKTTLSAE